MTREDPRSLESILRRIGAIEARQRFQMAHDPTCALLSPPYGTCDCWLNVDEPDAEDLRPHWVENVPAGTRAWQDGNSMVTFTLVIGTSLPSNPPQTLWTCNWAGCNREIASGVMETHAKEHIAGQRQNKIPKMAEPHPGVEATNGGMLTGTRCKNCGEPITKWSGNPPYWRHNAKGGATIGNTSCFIADVEAFEQKKHLP